MDCQNEGLGYMPDMMNWVQPAYDFEALYKQAIDLARRSQAAAIASTIRAEKLEEERDRLQETVNALAERLYRAEYARVAEPQAAYISELRDASPILAAIAVHQSQGVR